jgi:hypothetical protein
LEEQRSSTTTHTGARRTTAGGGEPSPAQCSAVHPDGLKVTGPPYGRAAATVGRPTLLSGGGRGGQASFLQGGFRNKSSHPSTVGCNTWKGQSSTAHGRNIKEMFADEHWKQSNFYYSPEPKEFSGPPQGLRKSWKKAPTMLQLFGSF